MNMVRIKNIVHQQSKQPTMKKIVAAFLLLSFAGGAGFLAAQEKTIDPSNVPVTVLKAFKKNYPRAEAKAYKIETEKGMSYFEIESVEGKKNRDLLFTADGMIIEIEESVGLNSVPDAVLRALKKDFPSGKVTSSEKTTRGSRISYGFVVDDGSMKYEVSYSKEGKRLSKEEVRANDEKKQSKEVDD